MRTPTLCALLSAALAALLAACGDCGSCRSPSGDGPPKVTAAWRGTGDVIEFSAWHMTCPGCTEKIETSIAAIEGVASAKADQESAVVTVKLKDPALREKVIPLVRAAVHEVDKKILGEDAVGPDA